jgi:hypothetical protein
MDTQSNLEDIAIVDYKYRADKLFDFSQIEQEHISSQEKDLLLKFRDDTRGNWIKTPPPIFLNQDVLN